MRKMYLIGMVILVNFFWTTTLFSQLVINEYSASNLSSFQDNYQTYEDWIEIYNAGDENVDLEGYYLSDKMSKPEKFQIPAGVNISPHSYLIFWCSGRNEFLEGHLHTNFKLTQTKDNPEHLVLSDDMGNILDDIEIQLTQIAHSRGRMTDGSSTWGVFTTPTLGASNNSATAYSGYAHTPTMDKEAGFYTESIVVSISSDQPDMEIHYTIDGHMPTASSPVYSSPLTIASTTIVNSIAISSDPTILNSQYCFNTYFINESHTLSVMSASADDLEVLLNGNANIFPVGTMEYFDENGVRTTFGYGDFNKHGQDSWVNDHRSIDYVSRDEYGYNYAIRHEMISTYTDRDEYQRVILRAAGDDNYPGIDSSAMLRDMLVEDLATKTNMNLDCRKGEKGILYVNGAFWGLYGFREKVSDSDYTKYYYDQDKYNIQYLMLWGNTWAQYGGEQALSDWATLRSFILNNDMTQAINYSFVVSQFDITSLVDYIHINSYVVCSDWINWNVGWWRGLNSEGGHKKWGYILWDEDATFAHYINYTGVPGISPQTSPCYPEGLNDDPGHHIEILNQLRTNPVFNRYYVSRYVDLLNTSFRSDVMLNLLDTIYNNMYPEMPQQIQRWGGSMEEWEQNVQKIRDFITDREAYIPTGLQSCWGLTGPYDITFGVLPEGKGKIQINSILMEDFPKEMKYYGGVTSLLKAIPADPAYEFDYWEVDYNTLVPDINTQDVSLEFSSEDNIIAHFKLKEYADSLVINEINYNSADDFNPKDWVEIYNPQSVNLDIAGWQFRDENDNHIFEFPTGTLLNAHEYLVLCKDTAAFKELFPDVVNYLGDFDFGLSNGGEQLRLFNAEGAIVDQVEYDDEDPWVTEPDGNGPTLELLHPSYDNNLALSWGASTLPHGSPGEQNSIFVSSDENAYADVSYVIFPNPMTENAYVQILSDDIPDDLLLVMYNVFGKVVRTIEAGGSSYIMIRKGDLAPGIYSVSLIAKNSKWVGHQKLIIK
jgi:hypothetical protein